MSKLQAVRGTKDLYGEDALKFNYIAATAAHVAELYRFESFATPIFEFSEVFNRTLGETSDIVTKEMYSFADKGGEFITLRPEFTASIVRSFISNGLQQNLPLRLFSYGPVFRYERPQRARQRQFHQINFEMLGVSNPLQDAELIAAADLILTKLGLKGKYSLELSSLGDTESRNAYRTSLVEYFSKYKNDLSEDSKQRLEKNPLRILDSKDENDKKIVAGAPLITGYYSVHSAKFFENVQEGLNSMGIEFIINPKIVRGLDYYNDTAFEFTTELLGSQGTILAGGRYDKLVSQMGGPEVDSVGFAGGFERMMELITLPPKKNNLVAIINIGDEYSIQALSMGQNLREMGIETEILLEGAVGKKMKKAAKLEASFAIIFGENEIKNGKYKLKNMTAETELEAGFEELVNIIKQGK